MTTEKEWKAALYKALEPCPNHAQYAVTNNVFEVFERFTADKDAEIDRMDKKIGVIGTEFGTYAQSSTKEIARLTNAIKSLQIRAWDAITQTEQVAVSKGQFSARTSDWADEKIEESDAFLGRLLSIRKLFDQQVEALLSPADGDGLHENTSPELPDISTFPADIDTVGNCGNCGVEFHIHKQDSTTTQPIWPIKPCHECGGLAVRCLFGLEQRIQCIYCGYECSHPTDMGSSILLWNDRTGRESEA